MARGLRETGPCRTRNFGSVPVPLLAARSTYPNALVCHLPRSRDTLIAMCGRYGLFHVYGLLFQRFPATREDVDYRPRYNIAPTQRAMTILDDGSDDGPHAEMLRWGLVPFWSKDLKMGFRTINARAETVEKSSAFRDSFRKRRCLVLASCFYEGKKEGKAKIPMFIGLESREPFAFAGLWSDWTSPEGESVRTYTIITTEPNDTVRSIHDRMPVILNPEDEMRWVQEGGTDLLVPFAGERMTSFPISTLVNSVKNDSPELVTPV